MLLTCCEGGICRLVVLVFPLEVLLCVAVAFGHEEERNDQAIHPSPPQDGTWLELTATTVGLDDYVYIMCPIFTIYIIQLFYLLLSILSIKQI